MSEPYAEDLERALAEIDKVIALEPRWPSGHVLSAQLLPVEARAIRTALRERQELRERLRELVGDQDLAEDRYNEHLHIERETYPNGIPDVEVDAWMARCSCRSCRNLRQAKALLAQPAVGKRERE